MILWSTAFGFEYSSTSTTSHPPALAMRASSAFQYDTRGPVRQSWSCRCWCCTGMVRKTSRPGAADGGRHVRRRSESEESRAEKYERNLEVVGQSKAAECVPCGAVTGRCQSEGQAKRKRIKGRTAETTRASKVPTSSHVRGLIRKGSLRVRAPRSGNPQQSETKSGPPRTK